MPLKAYFCTEFCANTLKNMVTRAWKLPKTEFILKPLKSDLYFRFDLWPHLRVACKTQFAKNQWM